MTTQTVDAIKDLRFEFGRNRAMFLDLLDDSRIAQAENSLKDLPGDVEYVHGWTRYAEHKRGMSRWRDIVDFVGGYLDESARTDRVFDFYRERGFEMRRLKCAPGRLGCNEFVFQKARHQA